jgi:hypothetical protein
LDESLPGDDSIEISGITKVTYIQAFDTPQFLTAGMLLSPMYISGNTGVDVLTHNGPYWTCPSASELIDAYGGKEHVQAGDVFGVQIVNNTDLIQAFNPGNGGTGYAHVDPRNKVTINGHESINLVSQNIWFKITNVIDGQEAYDMF